MARPWPRSAKSTVPSSTCAEISKTFAEEPFDAVIITLSHTVFREQFDGKTLASLCKKHGPLIDMRGNFENDETRDWFNYWRP